jgi:hypothetical protein
MFEIGGERWLAVSCGDRGDHRATVQGITGLCGSEVKGMLLFDEWVRA